MSEASVCASDVLQIADLVQSRQGCEKPDKS